MIICTFFLYFNMFEFRANTENLQELQLYYNKGFYIFSTIFSE